MGRTSIIPVLFTTLIAVALTFCSCTDEPSGPVPPAAPDTTSHEFVWEVDTLFFRGTTQPVYFQAKAFYGTSASNVYLAGYSNVGYECWRWNGYAWMFFDLGRYSLGDIADIDGVDSTFIVFLGAGPAHETIEDLTSITALDNGAIRPIPKPLGTRNRTCLHVVSRDEIYLGGVDGIQRYDGTKWEWMLDLTDTSQEQLEVTDIHLHSDGILEFTTQNFEIPNEISLWRASGGGFIKADSFFTNEQGMANIRFGYKFYIIDGKMMSASKAGLYERRSGVWEKIDSQGGTYLAGHTNDLYMGGAFTIRHYNGMTWQVISSLNYYDNPDIQLISPPFYSQGIVFVSVLMKTAVLVYRGWHP